MIEDEFGEGITSQFNLEDILYMDFELIEEQQDIDIQELEEINVEDLIIYKLLDTEKNEENTILNGTLGKKINELIKAVKQLDRREER